MIDFKFHNNYVVIDKPLPIELVERANNCDILNCRCGGEPQILYIESTKPWTEIRCTECQIRTEMKESPEIATENWNNVMK